MNEVDWAAVTAIATGLTVAASLAVFVIESRARARRDRKAATHVAVAHVLSSMENTIRLYQRPLLFRLWAKGEIEFALAIPRLRHNLSDADEVVVLWALKQTQEMIAAGSDKRSREIGIQMSAKLVEWNQGRVSLDWFAEQLTESPLQNPLKIPKANQAKRWIIRSSEGFMSGLFIALGLLAVFQIRKELRELSE